MIRTFKEDGRLTCTELALELEHYWPTVYGNWRCSKIRCPRLVVDMAARECFFIDRDVRMPSQEANHQPAFVRVQRPLWEPQWDEWDCQSCDVRIELSAWEPTK